jgi:hypothetical protein
VLTGFVYSRQHYTGKSVLLLFRVVLHERERFPDHIRRRRILRYAERLPILCKDGGYSPLNIANAVHRHLLFFSIFGG